jgi:hypothetical protein
MGQKIGAALSRGESGPDFISVDDVAEMTTMSRQPTWDQACKLQAEMFREAAPIGSLSIIVVLGSATLRPGLLNRIGLAR